MKKYIVPALLLFTLFATSCSSSKKTWQVQTPGTMMKTSEFGWLDEELAKYKLRQEFSEIIWHAGGLKPVDLKEEE